MIGIRLNKQRGCLQQLFFRQTGMPVMKDIVAQHMKQPRRDPFIAVRRQSTPFGSRIGQLKRDTDLLDTERIRIF